MTDSRAQIPVGLAATATGNRNVRALERANQARAARAGLKRSMAAGKRAVSELVLAHRSTAQNMALRELLLSQKQWGPVRCKRFLRSAGLGDATTLGSLAERQRLTVAALLAAGAASPRARVGWRKAALG
jgi:hypothetical protein